MRLDSNTVNHDINKLIHKIEIIENIIHEKFIDRIEEIENQIINLHEVISTGLLESIDNKIKRALIDYHTQIIDNLQKTIV
jgi:hypothetical protein